MIFRAGYDARAGPNAPAAHGTRRALILILACSADGRGSALLACRVAGSASVRPSRCKPRELAPVAATFPRWWASHRVRSAARAARPHRASWRVLPHWWLRREGSQAVFRCELRLQTARTAWFPLFSARLASLAGRGHARGEREHTARMPLPCHQSQRESTGCSKLNVAVHTRQRRGWLCSTLRVCARTCCRLAAGARIDRLGTPVTGCVHVATVGAFASWCGHGALVS